MKQLRGLTTSLVHYSTNQPTNLQQFREICLRKITSHGLGAYRFAMHKIVQRITKTPRRNAAVKSPAGHALFIPTNDRSTVADTNSDRFEDTRGWRHD
ncbi:hypothetical protein [Enteractinococcus helveticum]|uniref:hypothetical protein n=1 Tax=Enteractinococcus helveticum TaxID=1837282 RepID=UPI001237750C|nr:hypothetical protein [Enteractinococcus helveticum]